MNNSQKFQLPDQVATFKAMPILLDRSIVMASGVMKLAISSYIYNYIIYSGPGPPPPPPLW